MSGFKESLVRILFDSVTGDENGKYGYFGSSRPILKDIDFNEFNKTKEELINFASNYINNYLGCFSSCVFLDEIESHTNNNGDLVPSIFIGIKTDDFLYWFNVSDFGFMSLNKVVLKEIYEKNMILTVNPAQDSTDKGFANLIIRKTGGACSSFHILRESHSEECFDKAVEFFNSI